MANNKIITIAFFFIHNQVCFEIKLTSETGKRIMN